MLSIAIAIYLGLRSFTKGVSNKVDKVKEEVVMELSGIKESVIKIFDRAEDIWKHISSYLILRTTPGTIEVILKNFGKTKVSAEPASTETRYIIRPEEGSFNAVIAAKLSKKSNLVKKELELFNREPMLMNFGNSLRVILPSTDPDICIQYINFLLKWLDDEYIKELSDEINKFEHGIKL